MERFDRDNTQDAFNAWLDDLPQNRQLIAIQRACVELGWHHELNPEGGIAIDGPLDSDEFQTAVHEQFVRMFLQEALDTLEEEGEICRSRIDEDGEVYYALVED